MIFEVKLGRWGRPKFVKQKRRLGGIIYRQGMGIKNSLRPEVYEPKIDAVRQALDSDVGYVFIIPKDIYYKLDKGELESIIYSEFKKNNGLVIPFYTDRHTFQSEVIQKVLEYNLKVRPEPQKSL